MYSILFIINGVFNNYYFMFSGQLSIFRYVETNRGFVTSVLNDLYFILAKVGITKEKFPVESETDS